MDPLNTPGSLALRAIRAYRKSSMDNLGIDPLTCQDCELPQMTGLKEDDRPFLECLSCGRVTFPGSAQIKAWRSVTI
jgi:hypothetical protein